MQILSRAALLLLVTLGLASGLTACYPPGSDGGDSGSGGSKGAPGPIAGAGLSMMVAAGVWAVVRNRRSNRD